MTRLRRQRSGLAACALAAALCGGLVPGPWGSGHAATTESVVVDRHSGLAIYGFDPVAYFTDAQARTGRDDLELTLDGAAWRFCNPGNRAAFAKDPEVYKPRFGGYDPVALSRGVTRDGHPKIWTIHRDRLFLFYSDEALREFHANAADIVAQAEARWPALSRALTP